MSTKFYFRFEKFDIWKEARDFVSVIYTITASFPSKEQFGLTNQIRRAAVSIVLNIAEGSVRSTDADFRRFLKMAQGSVHEVVAGFYVALDQKFVNQENFDRVYNQALKINAQLNAFIKKL